MLLENQAELVESFLKEVMRPWEWILSWRHVWIFFLQTEKCRRVQGCLAPMTSTGEQQLLHGESL